MDATFVASNGRSSCGFAVWFNGSLLFVSATIGPNLSSAKEEECEQPFMCWGRLMILGLPRSISYALEVVEGTNGRDCH